MRRETVLKIVGLLRKNLGGFTILEISKLLKIGYRPAYNHVAELEKIKAITTKKVGSAKQCSLNLENAQSRHFLQEIDLARKEELYKSNQKIKAILDDLLSKIASQIASSLHSIILFGSYAKGTATKSSDIDLLFIVSNIKDKPVRDTLERECASYQHSHNIKISPLITNMEEFRKMLKSKEINVGKEAKEYGIALYGSEQFWRLIAWQE
ncbi:MAG TPA: nucleotidyltransferase domain-containing protein [Candidatus Nanoarchaeia archaeon]|nr:nucleotidyltransferase domain-containing protein [Candidatus Nanoarchaeia archaeon]